MAPIGEKLREAMAPHAGRKLRHGHRRPSRGHRAQQDSEVVWGKYEDVVAVPRAAAPIWRVRPISSTRSHPSGVISRSALKRQSLWIDHDMLDAKPFPRVRNMQTPIARLNGGRIGIFAGFTFQGEDILPR